MSWIVEKRKQGMEIYVTNRQTEAIFVGEGYTQKEYKRSMDLGKVIAKELIDYEEKNEEDFEKNNFSPILFNFIKNHESNSSKRIILSEQDVIFYKKVFEFQKLGKWKEAENILNQIDNKTNLS